MKKKNPTTVAIESSPLLVGYAEVDSNVQSWLKILGQL